MARIITACTSNYLLIVKTILSSWFYRGIRTVAAKRGGGPPHTIQTPSYPNNSRNLLEL